MSNKRKSANCKHIIRRSNCEVFVICLLKCVLPIYTDLCHQREENFTDKNIFSESIHGCADVRDAIHGLHIHGLYIVVLSAILVIFFFLIYGPIALSSYPHYGKRS